MASRPREWPPQIEIVLIAFTQRKFLHATVRSGRVGAPRGSAPLWKGFGMIKTPKTFLADQDGATAIEYALIASLIAVFIIGALSALGTSLSSEFAEVGSALK
jgi:pilus assembly protein Flp/PilA